MRTALIVGAGIGGLAAALALRRAGWDVRVFERAASPGELGFALLLAPNAMHALGALGLAEVARRNARVGSIKSAAGCWMRDMVIRLIPESVILKSLVALGRPPLP
jgi:2-polyprenyl-6-methoxyphenol hydroxylase-like FAD-dependent oxidoreductase